jgi:hypothetical protein
MLKFEFSTAKVLDRFKNKQKRLTKINEKSVKTRLCLSYSC